MSDEVLKKFGRYFLLDRIAQGGMAEIYRAEQNARDGQGRRVVVIKRILSGYGGSDEHNKMFKDEIRVTMGFNHPNVVNLFDTGEEQGQPFIAMEYVEGKNLRQVQTRYSEMQSRIPVEVAAYIAEQTAAGLDYAHSYKDKMTGESLNLVHRDISPQNILVSFDGTVKIIDFGIAKATTNVEATRAGVIKGKLSYLSPEQIAGEVLDGRCDIFALGIVLWEMLAGRKLFQVQGDNDFAILKQIEACQNHIRPPSEHNAQVPKELDQIVLKALARDREKRYQAADDFRRALHKFLAQFASDFSTRDLADAVKSVFVNDIVEDRKRLQRLRAKLDQLLASNPEIESIGVKESEPGEETTDRTMVARPPKKEVEVSLARPDRSEKIQLDPGRLASPSKSSAPSASQSPAGKPASARPGQAAVPTGTYTARPRPRPQAESSSSGSFFKIAMGILVVGGVLTAVVGPQLGWHLPLISQRGQVNSELPQQKPSETTTTNVTAASPAATSEFVTSITQSPKSISLRLNVVPLGGPKAKILINGRAINEDDPLVLVPLDEPLEIFVEKQGFRMFRRDLVLDSRTYQGLRETVQDLTLEPVKYGYVTLHTTPSADALLMPQTLDGRAVASDFRPWRVRTPVENLKFPVGVYSVKLENRVLGAEKSISITVDEARNVRVDEKLELKP